MGTLDMPKYFQDRIEHASWSVNDALFTTPTKFQISLFLSIYIL